MTSSASWDALQNTILQFTATQDASSGDTALIKNLLLSLDKFVAGWLAFFGGAFQGASPRLEKSGEVSDDYIQRLIIENAAHDLDIIVNAYLQRLPLTKSFNAFGAPGLQDHLRKTDALARAALAPARASQLATSVQAPAEAPISYALTYYNQSTQLRLLPYYPVVLIGVPFSSINWDLDLCAIPHELGHVVYRVSPFAPGSDGTGQVKQRVLAARIRKGASLPPSPDGTDTKADWYEAWEEEMFADVYGCVVAGPYIARHFMTLSKGWKSSELAVDPGGYPSPLIRPYVYIATLNALQERFPELNLAPAIAGLTMTWNEFVGQHTASVKLPDGTTRSPTEVTDLLNDAVPELLAAILPAGSPLESVTPWPDRSTWSGAATGALPEIVVTAQAAESGDTVPQPLDAAGAQQKIDKALPARGAAIPASEWHKALDFGGWLDKGPEGGKAH